MTALEQLAASRERLETLDCLLDWYLDLGPRVRRAQLRFELCDVDTPELDAVEAEVLDFNRICRALSWSPQKMEAAS
jgi:hypothetical protein